MLEPRFPVRTSAFPTPDPRRRARERAALFVGVAAMSAFTVAGSITAAGWLPPWRGVLAATGAVALYLLALTAARSAA
jgi:hypothetical protein